MKLATKILIVRRLWPAFPRSRLTLDLGALTKDASTDKMCAPLDCADFQDQKLHVSTGKWDSEKPVLTEVDPSAAYLVVDAQMSAWLTTTAISILHSFDVNSIDASHVQAERRMVARLTLTVEDPPAYPVGMDFDV